MEIVSGVYILIFRVSWYFKEAALIDRSKYSESDTHTTCGWKG